jgi:hypothetical protein
VAQVGHVAVEDVGGKRVGFGSGDEGRDVVDGDVVVDEVAFKAGMDVSVRGVAVGVRAIGPTVVVGGDVERLRAVADVMAEPAGEEDDLGLDGLGVLMVGDGGAIVAEGRLEHGVHLVGGVRQQADLVRRELELRVLGLRGGESSDVRVTGMGKWTDEVGPFEVDVVLRHHAAVEGVVLGAPAVRLRAVVVEGIQRLRRAQELGDIRGKVRAGELVDERVGVVSPGETLLGAEERKNDGGGDAGEDGQRFHCGKYIRLCDALFGAKDAAAAFINTCPSIFRERA